MNSMACAGSIGAGARVKVCARLGLDCIYRKELTWELALRTLSRRCGAGRSGVASGMVIGTVDAKECLVVRQQSWKDTWTGRGRKVTIRNLKFQWSAVATRAAAGSEVGVGSEPKSEDREILVQHLLVKEDDVQLLSELQRQIVQEGQDLSDLAGEHSLCPSKAQGGMIGWVKLGQTDPAFEEAAFNAPLNRVVRVQTKHGWHLVQVLNERKAQFLEQLQVERLHERMQDPTFLEESQLIDVREPHEIATAAIKGFEAYPLSEFGKWAPNIADDLNPEKDTYVLCHHGMRSMQAATWLQSQGFQRLYNIVGGIHAYSSRVDSSIPKY